MLSNFSNKFWILLKHINYIKIKNKEVIKFLVKMAQTGFRYLYYNKLKGFNQTSGSMGTNPASLKGKLMGLEVLASN